MQRAQLFEQPEFLPPVEDLSPMAPMRVALTGQRGVLGGLLSRRCQAAGLPVAAFAGDVTDALAVDRWMREAAPELVFHCAAVVPVTRVEDDPMRAYAVNALGPYQVAQALIRHAPRAWLFLASTSHVYAPGSAASSAPLPESGPLGPATFYGVSKLAGERLAQPILDRFDVAYAIGRIFSFSHASQSPPYLVPSLAASISALPDGGELELRSASAVRDIVDAETVIDAVLHLARLRARGVLNIGSGEGRTVADIAQRVAAQLGRRIRLKPVGGGDGNSLVADVSTLRRVIARGLGQ